MSYTQERMQEHRDDKTLHLKVHLISVRSQLVYIDGLLSLSCLSVALCLQPSESDGYRSQILTPSTSPYPYFQRINL